MFSGFDVLLMHISLHTLVSITRCGVLYSTGDLDISVVAGYISERKRVHPAVEGRIQFSSSCAGLRGYTSTVLLLWAVWLMLV